MSLLSDRSIALPALFWLLFLWYVFFHPFASSLWVSLNLKWISYRQHIVKYWFLYIRPLYIFCLASLILLRSRKILIGKVYHCHSVKCILLVLYFCSTFSCWIPLLFDNIFTIVIYGDFFLFIIFVFTILLLSGYHNMQIILVEIIIVSFTLIKHTFHIIQKLFFFLFYNLFLFKFLSKLVTI